jgi:thiol-disulfide isomerase/thioredoxin
MKKVFFLIFIGFISTKCTNKLIQEPPMNLKIFLDKKFLAKPPTYITYEDWVKKIPMMKNIEMQGGYLKIKGKKKFGVALRDKNKNGIWNEINKDQIFLFAPESEYIEWMEQCSNVSSIQRKMDLEFEGFSYTVDSIDLNGKFISIHRSLSSTKKEPSIKISKTLPNALTVTELKERKEYNLSELLAANAKGKKYVYFNFWAPWCAPCIEDIPQLILLEKQGVIVVNVCDEKSISQAEETILKQNMPGIHLVGNLSIQHSLSWCGNGYPYGVLFEDNVEISRQIHPNQVLKIIE